MLAQQFDEFCQTALLVRTQVIVDMPGKVIVSEIVIVFSAPTDDEIQSIQSKVARFAQLAAQRRSIDAAAQSPNGIDKRQLRHFVPGCAQVPNLMLTRRLEQ